MIGTLLAANALWAQGSGTMATIYSFEAPPGATYPAAGPTISSSGIIYGGTFAGGVNSGCGYFNCGTSYELTQPAVRGGIWNETTLYSFSRIPDGYDPMSCLVLGSDGSLYGWASGGSNNQGAIFRISPPGSTGEPWSETVLYSFDGPPVDGGTPVGNIAIGANGTLYGATMYGGTYNDGTVFELSPPVSQGAAWTLTTIYNFHRDGDGANPAAGVVVGANGTIYGTTLNGGAYGWGTVFGMKYIGGAWQEKVLVSLPESSANPNGMALGSSGALYGQSSYNGIFEAVPPASEGGTWTAEVIDGTIMTMAAQSLAVGPNGAIYWTTPQGGTSTVCGVPQGCGALNELIPPSAPGGAWTPVVLHNFTGQQGDGYQPNPGLVVTQNGGVYGTTYYGGANYFGTAFRYTP